MFGPDLNRSKSKRPIFALFALFSLFSLLIIGFILFQIYHLDSVITGNDIEFDYDFHNLAIRLNLDIDRLPALPYISGNTLKGLADHAINNQTDFLLLDSSRVKSQDIIFVAIDYVDSFFTIYHKNIKNCYVLLTHNGANPAGRSNLSSYYNDPKLIAWYGQNMITK